jgi:DNA repair exonuclease SbcCD ATPase subunit
MLPIRLKMENFFSHKDSEIDFSKFDSALLIGNTEGDYSKSNGSGKSAIFESILWCLFNKSRASMMDDIVRWGETDCSVMLEFRHMSRIYRVIRKRNRMNSTSSVGLSFLDKAGDWNDISCSTSGDTNLKIESIIKLDYKTFINSIYFRQNDISEFAEADPSRKKEILKSIVDISRWDSYEKSAKKTAKEISLECKILKSSVEEYDDVMARLTKVKVAMAESEVKSKNFLSRKSVLTDEVSLLSRRYQKIKKSLDTDSYDRIIEELSTQRSTEQDLRLRLEAQTNELSNVSSELEAQKKHISSLASSISGKEVFDIPDGKIDDVRVQLTHFKSQKSSSEQILLDLSDHDISPDHCYTCRQDIGQKLYETLKSDHEAKRLHYKSLFSDANREILDLEKISEELLLKKRQNELVLKVEGQIKSEEYKLSLISEKSNQLQSVADATSSKLSDLSLKLKNNSDLLESIKNDDFQNIMKRLRDLKSELKSVCESISEEDKQMGRMLERESLLSEREAKMLEDKKLIVEKMKRASLFDKLSKMFGKNGIQAVLLDTVIQDLESASNETLASICNEPATIVLDTQRVGSDGSSVIETLDLKVRKDGHVQNFKSLSGGEQFRISLALRIALSNMSSRYGGSSLEFLLLDEVNSPLDRYGVETLFVNVIRSLEDKYKILVITHDESLKEKFDNVINITKTNGDSELEFTTR